MKKSELRQLIREELLKEAKYPSQYEAESLLDWSNATGGLSFGGAPEVKKAFDKAEKIRQDVWQKIFSDKSPWSVKASGKKAKVIWDPNKAKKLGL